MKAAELVEKLKSVFLSEDVVENKVEEVIESAELEAQSEIKEEVVEENLAEAPMEDEAAPEDVAEDISEGEDKYATKEELASAVAEMKAMYDAIMQTIKPSEEMEVPAELAEQKEEVELSAVEEAVQPLTHSPESDVQSAPLLNLFSQNRPRTTFDSVLSKIVK